MEVEFINYTGEYPALCMGVLTLKINGVEHTFGSKSRYHSNPEFPRFWMSGGHCYIDDDSEGVTRDEWEFFNSTNRIKIDRVFGEGACKQFLKIMNENTHHGCCGGCI